MRTPYDLCWWASSATRHRAEVGLISGGRQVWGNLADCRGRLPERPKGADCKSAGIAYIGSNPIPATREILGAESAPRILFLAMGPPDICVRAEAGRNATI